MRRAAHAVLATLAAFQLGCSLMIPPDKRPDDSGTDPDSADAADSTDAPDVDVPDDPGDPGSDGEPDPCALAAALHEPFGCEFWAVPLPMVDLDQTIFGFGVILYNPDGGGPATVSISRAGTPVTETTVAPEDVLVEELDLIETPELSDDTWSSYRTPDGAYHVISDRPILAHQYGPLYHHESPDDSGTVGSTLLVPAHALGQRYMVIGLPPISVHIVGDSSVEKRASYVSIVATAPATTLSITLSAFTEGSAGLNPGIPGEVLDIGLGDGEVLNLAAAMPPDCDSAQPGYVTHTGPSGEEWFCRDPGLDLTGTRIVADRPVAVFTGSTAALVPYDSWNMDHVAEQLPPVEALGSTFVIAPISDPDPGGIPAMVKVVAIQDGTSVDVTPVPTGLTVPLDIDMGDFAEFMIEDATSITASNAIVVAQYMVGREYGGTGRTTGDPAMVILTPVEQWTSLYGVALPSTWTDPGTGEAFALIAKPLTAEVTLDADTISGWIGPVGSYNLTTVHLSTPGLHVLQGDASFGAVVYVLGPEVGAAHAAGAYFAPIATASW